MPKQPLQNDRRTQKTRQYLAGALKELIVEKGYDAITIQDIIDRANVGRSTFYSHYESKEELLIGNINFQEALVNTPNDPENYPMGVNLHYLFHHTREHMHLVKAMAGTRSIDILSNYFAELCAAKIVKSYKTRYAVSKANLQPVRYKAEAAARGIVSMLFKWLADGATLPEEHMIRYAKEILHACMMAELKK
ncbi:MAG TPA: TetR/AcrR family transcriptional regulator [Chitinophaga sp.]|uniref:TetR/AcrR family transcriptional regulator n=1 Tax=Chitinophaga sp. TaxID=1869181 RepID=UPI002DBFD018|nr:TetR/AcrR family transcriptional regulator [Chitinophaga sp.]HEU4552123.1 TetR/AcrR family transcriptional regulator [Chitinophaga sp.]